METANHVDQLIAGWIDDVKAERITISDAVWNTAIACVGYPYVFGAWGEYCTPSNRKRRARDDHPTIISACQVLNGKSSVCTGCKWYPEQCNVRMFDCRGFTDWCLKQFGIDLKGEGATSQWNSDNWSLKGSISDIPDDTLVCLFVQKGKSMEHTGFGYKGQSCECSSGVQYFAKRKAKWTHFAVPKGIGGNMPDYRPTLRRGDKGEYVTLAQTLLYQKGYDLGKCGIDGSFGAATEKAVRQFQRDNGLKVDGIVGQQTWNALQSGEGSLYTVTIPHLPKYKAEGLINTYPGAYMTEEKG